MKKYYIHDYNITKIEQRMGELIIHTNGSVKLVLQFIEKGTLRVWMNRDGKLEPHVSYAIEEALPTYKDYTIQDGGTHYTIETSQMKVHIQKEHIHLSYFKKDGTPLSGGYEKKGLGWDEHDHVFMYHSLKEDEHFYGLGEDNDAYLGNLDRRGTTRDMISGQRINVGHVTADIPINFFMSTDEHTNRYGMFYDSSYLMKYDMGKESNRYYYLEAEGGELIFYFFAQDSFKDILNAYTNITGKPSMLPRWALGYTQSYCAYRSWPEMDDVIETTIQQRIPLDCMVFDFDWAQYMHNFKWHEQWEGKSPEKIKAYRKTGVEFMVSNCGPMLKEESDNYKSAVEAGIMAKDSLGNTITCGHYGGQLMDFSNPAIKDWLRPQLHAILDDEVKGWWLDLTEPEGDIEDTCYFDGPRKKVHNAFSLLNSKVYYELTKEYDANMRPFILTRTGSAGIQKYGNAIWTGDVFSDYKTLRAHCPEALNTTMSGIANWTSDSGGFISSTYAGSDNVQLYNNDEGAHALLYERWMQLSCFSPITRAHHVGPSSPYMFGDLVANGCRHYIQLRQKLLPYIYSYTYQTHIDGASIMRPLVYEYEDDTNVYNLKDEFLFGSELLVAPCLEEGIRKRDVYVPSGNWIDWDYGYEYEGNKTYGIYAPQSRIPVLMKKGAIIPMLQEVVENAKQANYQKLCIRVLPFETSTFSLYMDDGESCAYEKGEYTITDIQCSSTAQNVVLTMHASNEKYLVEEALFEVYVDYIPNEVFVNGQVVSIQAYKTQMKPYDTAAYFDYFNKLLYIKVKTNQLRNEIKIRYTEEKLNRIAKGNSEHFVGQLPFLFPPSTVPCRIQAENYDRGGEGIAYHIHTQRVNTLFRKDAVCIMKNNDLNLGYKVANLEKGEWLEYSVTVSEHGAFYFTVRLRGLEENTAFTIDVNTQIVSGLIEVHKNEEFECITTIATYLSKGEQVIRIFMKDGSMDLNWFEIIKK